jgi:predicted DNA-binding transcriptional regulator AlpA
MDKLLTIRDICNLCSISESTARRWLRNNMLPAPVHKIGSGAKLLWAQSVITSWAEQRASPVNTVLPNITEIRQEQRQRSQDWKKRQSESAKRLQAHRESREQRTSRSK